MKYLNIIILLLLTTSFYSCNDYLDEIPEKSSGIVISKVEELDALLSKNNFSGGAILDNNFASILCSDCFEITPEYYDAGLSAASDFIESYQISCWEMPYTSNTNVLTSMWATNFESIYLANLILSSVDEVSGSEEAKANVKYKAHFLRAYNYLELVNYYCMPYGKSTLSELGLPIKRSTSYEEDMHRASLEETYNFIEADIIEAVKLKAPLFDNSGRKSWKETGATVNALAARFYLAKEDYETAQKYAEEALKYGNDILDFNNSSEIDQTFTMCMADMSMVPVSTWWDANDGELSLTIGSRDRSYYSKNNYYMTTLWGIPSQKLLTSYNQQYDLRYKYFIVKEFQKIYDILGTKFDSLNGEAFYSDKMPEVIDILEKTGKLVESEGAKVINLDDKGMPPCLIIKSNGSTTYATRDLAAILYRARTYNFDKALYLTSYEQVLHFKQVFEVAKLLGIDEISIPVCMYGKSKLYLYAVLCISGIE